MANKTRRKGGLMIVGFVNMCGSIWLCTVYSWKKRISNPFSKSCECSCVKTWQMKVLSLKEKLWCRIELPINSHVKYHSFKCACMAVTSHHRLVRCPEPPTAWMPAQGEGWVMRQYYFIKYGFDLMNFLSVRVPWCCRLYFENCCKLCIFSLLKVCRLLVNTM